MPKVRARDSSRCLELLDPDFELFCNLASHNLRQLHGGRKCVSVARGFRQRSQRWGHRGVGKKTVF